MLRRLLPAAAAAAAGGGGRRLPPPHLVPSAAVSGTPKGKGKGKDAAPLKRSVVPKKKPASAPGAAAGGGGGRNRAENEALDRLARMADACLTAPTPLRRISAKARLREAEREKLGLIGKDRQREIDQLKTKHAEEPVTMGTPGLDLISLGLVDADKVPKYELTVEDGRRLAKEYSRVLMRKHRALRAAETNLLKCKHAAIEALPEKLKAAAMVPDYTPFPRNRFMATLTPPIEGYVDKVREATNKQSVKAKLR